MENFIFCGMNNKIILGINFDKKSEKFLKKCQVSSIRFNDTLNY